MGVEDLLTDCGGGGGGDCELFDGDDCWLFELHNDELELVVLLV